MRSTMLAALSSLCIVAHAGQEEPLKDLVFSGFLDVYYQHSFNNPGVRTSLFGRQFDTQHGQFTISSVQVNVQKKTTEENPFGFTLQLTAGKATDILHAAEPGGAETYKNLWQAYATYAGPGGLTVDLGKFSTWIGFESGTPVANDLYSISFLYFFCQPIYHVGIRASKPLGSSGATATAAIVNGWNEAEDSNGNKSYGVSLTTPIGSKTTVAANYYGGVEGSSGVNGFFGTGGGGKSGLNLADLVVVHQLTPKVKLALNADYGDVDGNNGSPSGQFRGIAGYVKGQLSDKLSATVRYDTVSDPNGVRSGIDGRFSSLTGGLEYTMNPASSLRLEIRADNSNQNVFEGDNGPKKTRTTLTIAHILKF
ncbi:MAG: outer membrane beta-barrel protein [Fimbriimonas sp.]